MLKIKKFITVFFVLMGAFLLSNQALASYTEINTSFPEKSEPLTISIRNEQAAAYHWTVGQLIAIEAYVEDSAGQKHYLRDRQGGRLWRVKISEDRTASLAILPALNVYSGRLNIVAEGKILSAPTPYLAETTGLTLEKVLEARFPDGAGVKVHYTDQILDENGVAETFPKQALDGASMAYKTITQTEGFDASGYSFADPDKNYAYDPDKIIDIYLGNAAPENLFRFHGFSRESFHDAPCFDTVKTADRAYQAVILLPANYREFIQNWEHLNPSSLGARNVNMDLRGTLIHEMLHAILFYYNKNLNHEIREAGPNFKKNLDWYVEGLARYFETFAGARHDFYSQGFRETLPDKIRFSRGGSNYFMRYPDQPFTELRYENALFWRFIDYQYGMKSIEKLSRAFRGAEPHDFQNSLEAATGAPFREILKKFALASLLNDFGLKEDAVYLKEIAKTRLFFKDAQFYLVDGFQNLKGLGAVCRTDWVGSWGENKAGFDDLPVAGDNTNASDVSGWATDYYEISFDRRSSRLPRIKILRDGEGEGLLLQLVLKTRAGSVVTREWEEVPGGASPWVDLNEILDKESLKTEAVEKVYILVTNLDPQKNSNYEIKSSI